jgi:hypothetical protein
MAVFCILSDFEQIFCIFAIKIASPNDRRKDYPGIFRFGLVVRESQFRFVKIAPYTSQKG